VKRNKRIGKQEENESVMLPRIKSSETRFPALFHLSGSLALCNSERLGLVILILVSELVIPQKKSLILSGRL